MSSSRSNPPPSVGRHTHPPAPIPSSLVSQATWDKIDAMHKRWGSTGLALTVVSSPKRTISGGGSGQWQSEFKSFGAANADGTPMTKSTMFPVGSCSKMITALYLLRLLEDGVALQGGERQRCTLDTRIKDILPEWRLQDPDATESITIKDLLTMRLGVSGHASALRYDATPKQALEIMKHLKPFAKPPTHLSYNNFAYQIVPAITERLTGHKYTDDVTRRFFDPMGMTDTTYSLKRARGTGRLADGFMRQGESVGTYTEAGLATKQPDEAAKGVTVCLGPGHLKNNEWCDDGMAGWGGLITTHADATKLLQAFLGEGSVISLDSLQTARAERTIFRYEPTSNNNLLVTASYGLGHITEIFGDRLISGHGGAIPGYRSWITQYNGQVAIFGTSNDDTLGMKLLDVSKKMILSDLLQVETGVDWEAKAFSTLRKTSPRAKHVPTTSPPNVDKLVGRYFDPGYGEFDLRRPTTSVRDQALLKGVPDDVRDDVTSTLIGHFHPSSVFGSNIVFTHKDDNCFFATHLPLFSARGRDGRHQIVHGMGMRSRARFTEEGLAFFDNFWNIDSDKLTEDDVETVQLLLKRESKGDWIGRRLHGKFTTRHVEEEHRCKVL